MGVSPEEDLTELSARNKEAEDVTVMSSRERAPEVVPPPDDLDDQTRLSARASAGQEETADVTRLSRRSAAPISGSAPASGRKARTDLPPGGPAAKLPAGAAQRGSFGQPAEEYEPREAPTVDALEDPDPLVPQPPTPPPGVDVAAARERREAARHRRLITAVIVVGVTAAVMTAALIGILALVRGE